MSLTLDVSKGKGRKEKEGEERMMMDEVLKRRKRITRRIFTLRREGNNNFCDVNEVMNDQ